MTKHEGIAPYRKADNPRERIFAEEWDRQNNPPNNQPGTLQWLLHSNGSRVDGNPCSGEEIKIAATVIQWLGSPVGFSWLTQVMEKIEKEVK